MDVGSFILTFSGIAVFTLMACFVGVFLVYTSPVWLPIALFLWISGALSSSGNDKKTSCLDVIIPFKEALALEKWDTRISIGSSSSSKSLFYTLHWLREHCASHEQFKTIPDPEPKIVAHMKQEE